MMGGGVGTGRQNIAGLPRFSGKINGMLGKWG
jgi:hypothetical protein